MTAFSAAIDAIFNDPNMAADAVWQNAAETEMLFVRVMIRKPDEAVSFGRSRVSVESLLIDVRVSELASPRKDDTIRIGDDLYRVDAAPRRDRDRLIWTLEVATA